MDTESLHSSYQRGAIDPATQARPAEISRGGPVSPGRSPLVGKMNARILCPWGRLAMRAFIIALVLGLAMLWALPGWTADDSKVKAGTNQVETGAKKIGDGKIGQGVEDTAKGIGKTVVEGDKFTGDQLKEAGKAAEPKAKTTWEHIKDGAVSFGQSVKNFFGRLFSG